MDLGLKGKKALVTGGTRGIGRAIADTLAAEGADVAICARNAKQIDDAVASLKSKGVNAFGGVVDIADGAALKTWIREAAGALGGIDILIVNASALSNGNSEEAWKAAFEVDLLGVVRAFEAAQPFLEQAAKKSGDASLTVISSAGAAETKYANSYGAMKATQIHLVKGLAYENAAKHVRVNAVSPGTVYFEGGIWHQIKTHNREMYEAFLATNPTGRMASPQEVANTTVFVASPAASFTTGSNLLVDGGMTVRVNF